ncbi:MAG TPA: glycoside hydrolase family 2 protein [Clostridiales bacterium]|nr:glycoside hydrolase family 2 protein [Clostridiales bacterium]
MRQNIKLYQWNFIKEAKDAEQAAAATGVPVTVPHTWNAIDGQDGGNDYYRGTCWYVHKLERPELTPGGRAYLEFNGAAMTAEVYFNGAKLARHEGGYSTFRVDITDYLLEENTVAVSVDNADNDRVYPQKADFTFYGGLYRPVNLVTVPECHFALDYWGGKGIKVTPIVEGTGAQVTVEVWVKGNPDSVAITLDGKQQTVPVQEGHGQAVFHIENVHLWDGVEDPFLYTAIAELPDDRISTRFGCRSFAMDPEKGFLLNGRSYPLRGVSRHQDRIGVGNALTPDMHREDMGIIREIGANTVRLAHYQHDQYFYDLCDEAGMVVWAEIPYITMHMPNGRENTLSQMQELIVQCYNHPSIVCWGLSNEITAAGGVTEDLLENHRLLNDLCHSLDKTRPTVLANVFMLEIESPLLEIPDVNSYNLYFGWYLGELDENDAFFDEYHTRYPDRCIGFSEYGADANPRFQTARPERGDYTEAYQALYHEHIIKMINERPYLWATHVWNMFDFAADGRDEGGEHGRNQKGLVTMDRKLKKDAFYLYKAHWGKEPFVHLCGSRYVDRAEAVTEVTVYSNQSTVVLYVDGKQFAEQQGKAVFRFQVPLSGEHTIEARAGEHLSRIFVRRVSQPNTEYMFFKTGDIVNWFDKEDFKPGYFSIKDTLGELGAQPQAAALMGQLMAQTSASRGDVAESVKDNPNLQKMMMKTTLESMLKQVRDMITPEQVKALNAALQQIKKPE